MTILLKKLKKSDEEAFEKIYHHFHQQVFRFSLSYVKDPEFAREITQQVFIRIWEKRQKLSSSKPLEGQIFAITRNLTIDNLRKQARDKTLEVNYLLVVSNTNQQTEDEITLSEYHQQVKQFINEMPPRRRLIFKMNKLEGLSMDEIAQSLSISPKTVDAHLQLAVKYLRKKLEGIITFFL